MSYGKVNKTTGERIPYAGNSGGGGVNIFPGTTSQWDLLTVEQKKQYDYTSFSDDYDDPSVVGDLENLTTETKTNIVSAINEVNDKVNSYHFSVANGKLCVTYKKTVNS